MEKTDKTENNNNKSHHKIGRILIISIIVIIGLSGLVTGGVAWHEQPSFCASCHTPMNNYVENYFTGDTTLLISKHASGDSELRCLNCHESNIGEQFREGAHWFAGNYTYPLKKKKFGTRSFCLTAGCHVEADIIEATKVHNNSLFAYNQHAPRHGKQECYTCHSMHSESVFSCNQCHNFELPKGWISPKPNGELIGYKE